MERRSGSKLSGLVAMLAIFMLITPTLAAFKQSYCSPQNTGNTDVYSWDWQSNGNCTNHCNDVGTYAFAIIQYKDCWCSNYIPRQQVNLNQCQKDCPGFPSEKCGSADDNLFIYIQNSGQPSGTAGGSSSSKPTSTIVSSSTLRPTSTQATSSSQEVTSTKPSSTPQSSQSSENLETSVYVITQSGAVVTRTIIQTPSSNPSSSSAPVRTGDGGGGSNIGAIVGGAVGGVLGLLALIGGLLFFLWRRRNQRRQAQDIGSGGSSGGITRNTSTMSKAGLLGGATDTEHQYPPRIATNFSTQNSRYGADQDSISPISNRRNSQPLMIDSRLNPNAVLTFAGANASRESVASLDDSRDYGRQLNVRNPDP
jgi:cell wall integrity and stress response component